ncbi:MAG: J domain-containing protein [Lachnospiraceae bacterium]|nr:J domain-containing protein [Lachnospiraceae bacterium]
MLDPYQVLGVGKYDEDQVVKKAYRQLSKQYHPDNNINNPNKEAAEETFKKIQQAYEQIMHERSIGIGGPDDLRRRESTSSNNSGGYYGQKSSNSNSTWNRQQTTTKDRYEDGWWNNTGSGNNNNNNSYSSNNGYYSGTGNNSYNRSGNNGNNGGYYSGNQGYNYNQNSNQGYQDNSYGNSNYGNGNYGSGSFGFGSGYQGGNYGQGSYAENSDAALNAVADNLNNRKFFEAWDLLNTMGSRNDVWYYYSAIANLGLGNSITALTHARKAKEMMPGRPEYDELINGIQTGALHYQGRSDMFVPQKANQGNTCLKIGLAMLIMNAVCGGGGVCTSIICC